MHLGVAATYRLHGGGANHLRNLLAAWNRLSLTTEHQITVFARPETFDELADVLDPNIRRVVLHDQPPGIRGRIFWEQTRFIPKLQRSGIDVLFSPGNFTTLRSPVPTVVLFQLVAPFCSSVRPNLSGMRDWLTFSSVGVLMRLSARRSTKVIFLSHYFRNLFREHQPIPTERAMVIPYGRDSFDVRPRQVESLAVAKRPYMLCLAHVFPYKNLVELVEGYGRAAAQLEGYDLVIAGAPSNRRYQERLLSTITRLGLGDRVRYVGLVPHEQIPEVMKSSHAFVMQSTCESISVTLMDALQMHLPIACARASVLPEIAADAALYFDPSDISSIAAALPRICQDEVLRSQLRQKAAGVADGFPTWDEVGRATWDVCVSARA